MSHKRKYSTTFSTFDGLETSRLKDVFPMKMSSEFRSLDRNNFKNHMAVALPFILFQYPRDREIFFYNLDEEIGNLQEPLDRLLNNSKKLNVKTGLENLSWSKLEKKYKKLPVSIRKKQKMQKFKTFRVDAENDDEGHSFGKKPREGNADQRLSFRFDNIFAVKQNFTFGERRTAPGEVHIIQTSEIPILYNEPKPEWRKNFEKQWKIGELISPDNDCQLNEREGRFDAVDQPFFNAYVLNPNCKYVIPENTIYVLVTAQKTLFSLDRMTTETYKEISKKIHFTLPNTYQQLLLQMEEGSERVVVTSSSKPKNLKSLKLNAVDHFREWRWINEIEPPKIIGKPKGRSKKEIKFTPTSMTTPVQQQQEPEQQFLSVSQNTLVPSSFQELTWQNNSVPSFVSEPTTQQSTPSPTIQYYQPTTQQLIPSPTIQYYQPTTQQSIPSPTIQYYQAITQQSTPSPTTQQQRINYIQSECYENINSPELSLENTMTISEMATDAIDNFLNSFSNEIVDSSYNFNPLEG